jgi:CRP/FNR family cyclic AMP-dependent transcriptional regulator
MQLITQGSDQPRAVFGIGSDPVGVGSKLRRETLETIELLRSLTREERAAFERRCVWRHVQAKQLLLEHNGAGADIYFLTSGAVRVLTTPAPDRDVVLDDIEAGGYFGEMAAIDGLPRSAAILAMTGATIASMPAAVFRELLHRHPVVGEQLLKQFVARIRALDRRVNEFSSMHVKNRIYAELLRRSRPDPTDHHQAIVSPPPTHAEIAGRVSTGREMVARELKALERAGLLAKRRGAFVITNVPHLVDRIHQGVNGDSCVRRHRARRAPTWDAAVAIAV